MTGDTSFHESSPTKRQGVASPDGHGATSAITILVVDDEQLVRKLTQMILEANGYRVVTAVDGVDASQLAESYDGKIDLLLTDVVMPNMGGKELAEKLVADDPELKVMFMSAFTFDDRLHSHGVTGSAPLLTKPFRSEALLEMVEQLLR